MAATEKGVFVLGASGAVGKEVLNELLLRKSFSRIIVITRRILEGEQFKDVEQKVVDFDNLEAHADAFQGAETGFCCLGTTRGKSGAAGFVKVDYDYVVNASKISLANGCKHFSVVSSAGASASSPFLYAGTKGKMEEELKKVGFERLSIFRPGFLKSNRTEFRLAERIAGAVIVPLEFFFPTRTSVQTTCVAKAMVNNAEQGPFNGKVEYFYNQDILSLGE